MRVPGGSRSPTTAKYSPKQYRNNSLFNLYPGTGAVLSHTRRTCCLLRTSISGSLFGIACAGSCVISALQRFVVEQGERVAQQERGESEHIFGVGVGRLPGRPTSCGVACDGRWVRMTNQSGEKTPGLSCTDRRARHPTERVLLSHDPRSGSAVFACVYRSLRELLMMPKLWRPL